MKRQMNGSNGLYKDGTPRGRNGENLGHANTAVIPQIGSSGLAGSQNRIKSSRQSHKPQNAATSERQQRAITPKSQQKMYQSININKATENRGNSTKLQSNYTQSMQNINQRINTFNSEYLQKNVIPKMG